jgi:filamentous hemagglutinin
VEIDLSKDILFATPDGKVFVFNNGIFNTEEDALKNAANQLGAAAMQGGTYTIVNPATGNPISEVVFAGLDKAREITGLFGMSTASEVNIALRNLVAQQSQQSVQNGGPALSIVEVDHSRGSLTSSIATQEQIKAGQANVPLGSVTFNGAAANAQRMADRADIAISGQGKEIVRQATHPSDPIGIVIGGNEPQSGLSVPFLTAHGSYSKDPPLENNEDGVKNRLKGFTDQAWGKDRMNAPINVAPHQMKVEK